MTSLVNSNTLKRWRGGRYDIYIITAIGYVKNKETW